MVQNSSSNSGVSNENTTTTEDDEQQEDLALKILVIGEAACGKTSIIHKYCLNKFEPKYKVTMGLDFFPKNIEIDNQPVNLALWDVAGQERFHHMIRSYFQNANGAIIVFDLTRIFHTLNSASKWKLQLDICFPDDNPIPSVLLANKCDLFNVDDAEIKQQLDEFIAENGIKQWFFTSAKEGGGIDQAMEYMARSILESKAAKHAVIRDGSFKLSSDRPTNNNDKKDKKCC